MANGVEYWFLRLVPLVFFFFLSSTSLLTAQGDIHYYDFVLRDTNFTKLCETKSVPAINGTFPGPVLRVHRGDKIYVNFHNHGSYGVTLHWHGVKQPRNPWSDGPEYITQCPVQPGYNFTYEVILSDEEGTLWWHAHSDWTRATVHGAIVIQPANGSIYPFPEPDAEEVIILGNWFLRDLAQMLWQALEVTGGDTPVSDAYTINGEPGDLCACSNGTTYRLTVDYGKTYLLRLINAADNAELFFAIAGHNVTVVGMDASYTKPFSTSYLVISPGQTADVLFTAGQTPAHYYMAAHQFSADANGLLYFDHSNATGIIQYSGNYTPSPPEFPGSLPPYKDAVAALSYAKNLRSLANSDHPIEVPENITERLFYVVSMGMIYCPNDSCDGIADNRDAASINNISFVNPSSDILSAYYLNITGVYETGFPNYPPFSYNYTGGDLPESLAFPEQGTEVKVLEYGEQVQIVFQGNNVLHGAETHPMHLHGHSFYVIGFGLGNFDETNDTENFNLVDPPRLNTFSVPRRGWSAIRFTAKNPGVWFLHCHLDRHMSWGMDTAFIVKDGNTSSSKMMQPPNYMPLCNISIDSNTSSISHLISNDRGRSD